MKLENSTRRTGLLRQRGRSSSGSAASARAEPAPSGRVTSRKILPPAFPCLRAAAAHRPCVATPASRHRCGYWACTVSPACSWPRLAAQSDANLRKTVTARVCQIHHHILQWQESGNRGGGLAGASSPYTSPCDLFVITSKTAATATTSKATKAPMTINFLLLAGAGAAAEVGCGHVVFLDG